MRICVFGAGAIGSYIGARLANAAHTVTLVARGPHLAALRDQGVRLIESGGSSLTVRTSVAAADDILPAQDAVLVTLKGHEVPAAVEPLARLAQGGATLVFIQNGLPWWYFYGLPGPLGGKPFTCVDPDAVLWRALDPASAVGAIVKIGAEIIAPGIVKHDGDGSATRQLVLGELDGRPSNRIHAIAAAADAAGLATEITPRIRTEIWAKLLINLFASSLGTLTEATSDIVASDPGLHPIVTGLATEGYRVGQAVGAELTPEHLDMIVHRWRAPRHRTSMLQDLLAGRTLEIDPIVRAVAELGDLVGIDTPLVDTVLALVIFKARAAGLYPRDR
ncbi:MAG: 2-dehydropantoate 2-reductase [Alphaproteobacteria bacterium]